VHRFMRKEIFEDLLRHKESARQQTMFLVKS